MQTFPTLYTLASTGKTKQWQITVNDNGSFTTTHGQVGGKQQVVTKHVKGKSIGRANETTPYTQALKEATAKNKKKVEAGGVTDIANVSVPKIPMLAQSYSKRSHNVEYDKGVFIQPKLDGLRCIATRKGDTIEYTSRTVKTFENLEHLTPYLLNCLEDGEMFDGELYIHGLELRHIVSLVKKFHPAPFENKHGEWVPYATTDVQLWVYDMPDDGTSPFSERYANYMKALANKDTRMITRVHCNHATDEARMKVLHDDYIKQGYEGAIIRNKAGLYGWDKRSKDLQKYKEFFDAEFKIVDATAATNGAEKGCVIWICETTDGKETFNVRPRGSRDAKRSLNNRRNEYIGKQLTVRYQTLIKGSNIPQFGVGIAIREDY